MCAGGSIIFNLGDGTSSCMPSDGPGASLG